jgi:hypothetical protein
LSFFSPLREKMTSCAWREWGHYSVDMRTLFQSEAISSVLGMHDDAASRASRPQVRETFMLVRWDQMRIGQLIISALNRACIHMVIGVAVCLVGCYGDDPDDPERRVDFITFLKPGTFREYFVDTSFRAGEVAFDVLGTDIHTSWRLGPGSDFVQATDHDLAPYPNPMLPRKSAPHDGTTDRIDKRYWVRFAGGTWRSLGLRVEDVISLLRASSSPPSFFPQTVFMWCPDGSPCVTWQAAVMAGDAWCWRFDATTRKPVRASALACLAYHPRMHWRIDACDDDCDPIPTVSLERDESGEAM